MIHWIIEPLSWGAWMPRALGASVLAAALGAWVGTWLYLRRLSMLGDAMAHVALPGILVAFLLSGSLAPLTMLVGAVGAGAVMVALIEALGRVRGIRRDAAVGIVFSSMFAAGVIGLSTLVRDAHIDVQCMLFGDVLAVSDASLRLLAALVAFVAGTAPLLHRMFALAAFDPTAARLAGVRVTLVHYGLALLAAASAVAAFEAVGTVLFLAFVVIPPATAHRLAQRLVPMLLISTSIAVFAAVVGLYLAVWNDWSPAGTQVIVSGVLYAVVVASAALRQRLSTRRPPKSSESSA